MNKQAKTTGPANRKKGNDSGWDIVQIERTRAENEARTPITMITRARKGENGREERSEQNLGWGLTESEIAGVRSHLLGFGIRDLQQMVLEMESIVAKGRIAQFRDDQTDQDMERLDQDESLVDVFREALAAAWKKPREVKIAQIQQELVAQVTKTSKPKKQ